MKYGFGDAFFSSFDICYSMKLVTCLRTSRTFDFLKPSAKIKNNKDFNQFRKHHWGNIPDIDKFLGRDLNDRIGAIFPGENERDGFCRTDETERRFGIGAGI